MVRRNKHWLNLGTRLVRLNERRLNPGISLVRCTKCRLGGSVRLIRLDDVGFRDEIVAEQPRLFACGFHRETGHEGGFGLTGNGGN